MDGLQRHNQLRVDGTEHYTRQNVRSTMPLSAQLANDLAHGAAYLFSNWPNSAVPTFGGSIRSGTATAALLTWACPDAGSLPIQSIEIRPEACTRASKATPVADAVAISFVFT
jgi:hypothetical protein